jgi:hypothetical protein
VGWQIEQRAEQRMRRALSLAGCALVLCACAEPSREPGRVPFVTDGATTLTPVEENRDARAEQGIFDAALDLEAGADPARDAARENAPDAGRDAEQPLPNPDAGAPVMTRTLPTLPNRWQLLDAGADPFPDRPALVDCAPAGVLPENLSGEDVLGVETGLCGYLTAQQPTQRAVAIGEVLKVRLWHFELAAPDPAEARALLEVDGLRVLDERIPIPSPGGLIVRQLRVERAIPAGAPVYFHLHNHGANSWALVELSAGPG